MIKPIHLFFALVAGFLIGVLVITFLNKRSIPVDPHGKQITELETKVKWRDFKIERFEDTLKSKKIEIQVRLTKQIEAEKRAARAELKYYFIKGQQPISRKDSIVYLEAVNEACDSVIQTMDSVVMVLKKELVSTNEYLIVLDSGFNNSQQENIDLKKIDSLRVMQLKDCQVTSNKKKVKTGVVGFVVGFLFGKSF